MGEMEQGPQFALRRTMPASWVHLLALEFEIDRRRLHAVGEHLCIIDLAPLHGRAVVCNINGEWISRSDWWQPVRDGDIVVFCEVAGGGGGSKAGQVLAMLAVAVVTGGAVGAIYGLGWGLAAGAAVAAGGLLVQRMFPVEQSQAVAASASMSPTYSATLQGNQARLGLPVPVRYGQEMFFPDQAAPPYSEFAGSDFDQFYCTALAVGLGEYEVLSILIDDTPIQHFADVEVAIVGPGMGARTQQTGYDGVETFADQTIVETGMVTSAEVGGQDLLDNNWAGPFTALKSGFASDKLFIDVIFPRGLGTVSDDTGEVGNRTLSWQVAAQPIDDAGNPTGDWQILATESRTESTSKVVRASYGYDVAPARYRVRLRRVSGRSDNNRHLNDMQWAQLRCRITVPGIAREDLTGVAIRIRSSRQLSALTQRRVRIMARRLVPVHNGAAWQPVQFTRNPAWALADVWRNASYGRGLPDSRVDIESLLDYASVWAARQDRFDFSFDQQLTTDDAAQLVAAAGRARTMLRRGAVYSLVRDEQQSDPLAVFMPRNMDADSFGLQWVLPTSDTPDCIAATYRDGRYWEPRTVYAQIHGGVIYGYVANAAGVPLRPGGVPAPSIIEDVQLKGIVGEKQAIRQAAYLMARMLYRREEGSFTADLDGLLMPMGSLIAMAHDTASWGQSGDCVDWDADALTLTVTEPPAWTDGETHYIRLQGDDGVPGEAIEVTPGVGAYEVVLADAPSFAPSVSSPDRERTRYLFGALADVQRFAVMAAVRPTGPDSVEIPFFLEDNRVHAADASWLPTGAEVQDPLSDGVVVVDDLPAEGAFVEDFEDGLGEYTLVAGGAFCSLVATEYGQSLQIASIDSGTVHRFRRDLPGGLVLSELTVKFRITAMQDNDAGWMEFRRSGNFVCRFQPKRTDDEDGQERPTLHLFNGPWNPEFGGVTPVSERWSVAPEQLEADIWYLLRILIVPGAGNTSASITRIEDNELMGTRGFAQDYGNMVIDQLEWQADTGGPTTAVQYDDLTIAS